MNAYTQEYAAASEASAIAEIIQSLPAVKTQAGIDAILKALAANCEEQSYLENDDMNIIASAIEDCRTEIGQQLEGGDPCEKASDVLLADRERAEDMRRG